MIAHLTNLPKTSEYMDYTSLGLGPAPSLITALHVSRWGTDVRVVCSYDPQNSRRPYELHFQNCRRIQWDVHDAEGAEDESAELIGLLLGEGGHGAPAILTTDIFELQILYGSFHLRKDW